MRLFAVLEDGGRDCTEIPETGRFRINLRKLVLFISEKSIIIKSAKTLYARRGNL